MNNLKTLIKKISAIFLVLFTNYLFSQKNELKIDSILNLEIINLKEAEVEFIGYTKLTCIGYGVYANAFLFWKKDTSTFVQKIEISKNNDGLLEKFRPIKIVDSSFFGFYRENNKDLIIENVQPFEYKPDSVFGSKIYSSRITNSHSCFRYFKVLSQNGNFEKRFDYFDLREVDSEKVHSSIRNYTEEEIKLWEERGFEGMVTEVVHKNYPKKNLNYHFNKSLQIVKWDKIISVFIEKLERDNKFELIKKE